MTLKKPTVLICAAMKEEIQPLVGKYPTQASFLGNASLFLLTIFGENVFLLLTGIGGKKSSLAFLDAVQLLRTEGIVPDFVVVGGIAGGVSPSLSSGDSLSAREVLSESPEGEVLFSDAEGALRRFSALRLTPLSSIAPGFPLECLDSPYLLSVADICGSKGKSLLEPTGIAAVEMETFAIAQAARSVLPDACVVSLRTVADANGEFVPELKPDEEIPGYLVRHLIRPWIIFRFFLFFKKALRAIDINCSALVALLDALFHHADADSKRD